MNALVYLVTNLVNGKRYIGITSQPLGERRSKHLYHAKRGTKTRFYAAVRKYGEEMFRFTMLKRCTSIGNARNEERRLIAALCPEYNLTAGGEGVFGLVMSAASRELMAATKRGRPAAWIGGDRAPEIRAKIRRCWDELSPEEKTARLARMYEGRDRFVASGDHRLVVRRAPVRPGGPARKAVLLLNTGEKFESVTAAARALGLTTGQVSRACATLVTMRNGTALRYVAEEDRVERRLVG